MGDRGNIVVTCNDEQICFYTHWEGYKIREILKSAIIRGMARLDDFQYFNRILFCQIVQDDVMGLTGYGISQKVYDGDNNVLYFDIYNQLVTIDNKTMTVDEFLIS